MIARRALPKGTDPYAVWRALGEGSGRVALESLADGPGTGRWSIVASRPLARLVWVDEGIEVVDGSRTLHRVPSEDPFAALRETLAWFGAGTRPDLGDVPFAGGAIGWLSYELGRRLLPAKFPGPRPDADPPMEFALYGGAVVFDRVSGEAWAVGVDTALSTGDSESSRLADALEERGGAERRGWSPTGGRRTDRGRSDWNVAQRPRAPSLPPQVSVEPPWDKRERHREGVERIRRYIESGDVYQANLSVRFEAPCTLPLDVLWGRLRATSPEPFGACIEGRDRAVFSASMERMLAVRGREVETRPIKGTRARGASDVEDERLKRELATSEKDSAELLMIVDLHRNDLGKVCRPGSVQVPTLFGVRTFARVHHLEATIRGLLRDDKDAIDALRALFPAGSITGAPKVRAMQVLEEVETEPRGVYCGAIGYLGLDGAADFAVAIRSAVLREGTLRWSAGGGIVWDSDPAAEWREVLAKAAGFHALIG